MDFFNELGSKLSSTGKEVAEKAKELAEIAKLNAKIVAEEGKLAKAYTEIGKLYYHECHGKMDDVYASYAEAATDALEEIVRAKEQIAACKGGRVCVACGKTIGRNDLYCPHCGEKNEPMGEEEDQICPVCKSVIPGELAECPTCGEKLKPEEEEIIVEEVIVDDEQEA